MTYTDYADIEFLSPRIQLTNSNILYFKACLKRSVVRDEIRSKILIGISLINLNWCYTGNIWRFIDERIFSFAHRNPLRTLTRITGRLKWALISLCSNRPFAFRNRGRWMHGRRIRLRGADWQAENMAVPSTICEESLLRIPEDDLCWLIILKSKKNGEKSARWFARWHRAY